MGVPLPCKGEFAVVIMIEVVTEEMDGSDRVSCPETITIGPWLVEQKARTSTRAKWRARRSPCVSVLEKCLTPPTLSERGFYVNNDPTEGGATANGSASLWIAPGCVITRSCCPLLTPRTSETRP